MFSSLVHLILSLSISYPYLITFHDFADNSQEWIKNQMRSATQAEQGMTLRITLICVHRLRSLHKALLHNLTIALDWSNNIIGSGDLLLIVSHFLWT
jgi:hypothetical protein